MSKKCAITKKKPLSGNNVSKAINKTKRKFLPNLQNISFFSEKLGKKIKLKVSVRGIKSVEHNGGIDNYILSLRAKDHTPETLIIKKNLLSVK
ncbi:MAG: 50S ribosomal protein L28 [Rickettsiales bacterium TMED254]|nr:50S ribosomal protein L28 [Rickettsiales bacterium]RPF76547.1 MAG: 50S ribosomal protein L28 [Rickettsiales bacterium TMED254]|tara:strand:- start:39 stop:317 length:279 start_codon:yes stop_codon:yes gene_type:complete